LTSLHFVVPDGIDDPARPSGGNTYDRHLCRELAATGWSVQEHPVSGFWSPPDATAFAALDRAVQEIPDGSVVLIDGLVASTAPEVLVPQARRLRLVVLVHMPLGDSAGDDARVREGAVLSAAAAVVTTSESSRRRLLALHALPAERVYVAAPAVDMADPAAETATGGSLLCVAAVIREKGHDVLLEALASVTDLSWRCDCVGSLDRDPAFVDGLRHRAVEGGFGDRVRFPGVRSGADLGRAYAAADLMVLASRAETYGIVVIEALARAVPVVATDVGGVSEALGPAADGARPGLLVPPEEPAALGAALRAWLTDAELRSRLRRAARRRRESLPTWTATASVVAGVLAGTSR
jgi:glycosyltransferase involved in cell wall biosynthesis